MKLKSEWIILVTLAVLFVGFIFIPRIFTGFDLAFQLMAACLGAFITMIITRMLLQNQSASEEEKEKNIKIYESKILVYSDFVSKMWKTLNDDVVLEQEVRDLRSEAFSKLVFYMNNKNIDILAEKVALIEFFDKNDKTANSGVIRGNNIKAFAEITKILQDDLKQDEKANSSSIANLWKQFKLGAVEDSSTEYVEEVSTDEKTDAQESSEQTEPSIALVEENPSQQTSLPRVIQSQTWHFNAWDANKQIQALANGLNELSLVEYGEVWRTNLVKHMGIGDIVFLFRTGGAGYIGAYEIAGWRVYTKDGETWKETIKTKEGVTDISDSTQVLADLSKSDIYGSVEDGSSSVANVIVNPIVQCTNWGVSYPGGVYRRTVSRYDSGYAWILMSRLLRVDEGYKTIFNEELFNKLVSENHVIPAEYDDKKGWL